MGNIVKAHILGADEGAVDAAGRSILEAWIKPGCTGFGVGTILSKRGSFVAEGNAFGVRFLPSGYIAPHRVAHDLTERQREILQIVARNQPVALRDILEQLSSRPATATVRDDLYHLKRLGVLDSKGRGRGAVWLLTPESPE